MTVDLAIISWILICIWAADFVTGFFHWLEDTYCELKTPVIGPNVCADNIQHHLDQLDMVRNGTFLSRNYQQWLMAIVACSFFRVIGCGDWRIELTLFLASFGNQFHYLTHCAKRDSWYLVEFFRDIGLLQSRRQHSDHHKRPFDRNYCVITQQLNPVLEMMSFWRGLEFIIQSITGLTPKRDVRPEAKPVDKKPNNDNHYDMVT